MIVFERSVNGSFGFDATLSVDPLAETVRCLDCLCDLTLADLCILRWLRFRSLECSRSCLGLITDVCRAAMVFVMRLHGSQSSLGVCRASFGVRGALTWASLPLTWETFVQLSVSKFGDLGSYAALSRGARCWRLWMASSMVCIRTFRERRCVFLSSRLCWFCSDLGLPCGDIAPCCLCGRTACEDCLAAADHRALRGESSVSSPRSKRSRTSMLWVCTGCGDDLEPRYHEVPSQRTWLLEALDSKVGGVLADYELGFWVRLVTLAGDEVLDERHAPVGLIHTRYPRRFDDVWADIYSRTGGRIRHIVCGLLVVDSSIALGRGVRWSDFLTRSQAKACDRDSPFVLHVLLRGWW